LIEAAEGLFIWARITCDLLQNSINPVGLLNEWEKEHSLGLDDLYKCALDNSVSPDSASRTTVSLTLGMLLAAREPLPIEMMEQLVIDPGLLSRSFHILAVC
jgi:hypothetical protein